MRRVTLPRNGLRVNTDLMADAIVRSAVGFLR
jgi:hypothetical protein